MPRLGQAIAQPVDVPRAFQHHRPEAPNERIGNQRCDSLEHATAETGEQIRVQVKIKEGEKERLQAFEGLVIAVKNGPQGTFTVRKMSFGQGVERIFPFNSKVVDKVEKIRSYRVRRAKLFYIRALRGKAARMKEVARDKA